MNSTLFIRILIFYRLEKKIKMNKLHLNPATSNWTGRKSEDIEYWHQAVIPVNNLEYDSDAKSKKIGIVTENNIYLFNENGTVLDDFPLAGSTLFSINDLNNDNTTNLVVADKDLLYMYNLE